MIKLFKPQFSHHLGIDISASSVQLLEFGVENGRIYIEQGFIESLPVAALGEKDLANSSNLRNVIQSLSEKVDKKRKGVALSMSGSEVLFKTFSIDPHSNPVDLDQIVSTELKLRYPDLYEACYWDYQHLSPEIASASSALQVVLCQKDRVDPWVEVLKQAGMVPQVFDLEYYALQRALSLVSEQLPLRQSEGIIGLVLLDYSCSTFLVVRGDEILYTRSQVQDNRWLLDEATHQMGVDDWFSAYVQKLSTDSALRWRIAKLMAPGFFVSLRQMLRFYASAIAEPLDCLVLGGDCALIPELAELIEKEERLPAVVANPLLNLKSNKKADTEILYALGPAFMRCSGMALGKYANEFH